MFSVKIIFLACVEQWVLEAQGLRKQKNVMQIYCIQHRMWNIHIYLL